MDTLDQIKKLQEQIKKNEKELATVKDRQQKVDAKIKELNQKRRSLQMKSINKARAANRKRHILLGEALERFMGKEIDPYVFEAFLKTFGAYILFKKNDDKYYRSLPTFYEEWIDSSIDPQTIPLTGKKFLSFADCQDRLETIAENEEKRKMGFKQGDLEFVHEIEWQIDEDRITLGMVPKYDDNR